MPSLCCCKPTSRRCWWRWSARWRARCGLFRAGADYRRQRRAAAAVGLGLGILSIAIAVISGAILARDLRAFRTNPVMLKELRGRMRGIRAFMVMTIYLGLMSAFTVLLYLIYAHAGTAVDRFDGGGRSGTTAVRGHRGH
ncbi:MAG: hypothetical protein U0694_23010 [Anaerolineae bacterium]